MWLQPIADRTSNLSTRPKEVGAVSNVAFWITLGGILTVALLAYRSAKKAQAEANVRNKTSRSPEATLESPDRESTPKAEESGN